MFKCSPRKSQGLCFTIKYLLIVAIIASTTATATRAAAQDTSSTSDGNEVSATSSAPQMERKLYISGGGWGHGVGMSQYGALGRAEAGFSYSEILRFYYHGTKVVKAPELVSNDVDVRIGVHSRTVFTPTGPTGLLTVSLDGKLLNNTTNRLTVRRGYDGWYIDSGGEDWCDGFCEGSFLTVGFTEGEPVHVSDTHNGTRFYAYGEFQLTPATADIKNCGDHTAGEYCLVIGDMKMQQYLYGLAEIPQHWYWNAKGMEAQAIAARSYAIAQIRDRAGWGEPFSLYSVTDQVYKAWG